MSHDWILRFLQHRIADKPILRLIAKWLKVGISRVSQRNLGAAVSVKDGRLERVYRGLGIDQENCECHPDTGRRIQGLMLPFWQEAKDLCLEAAMLLPGLGLQSWDIALGDEGPVLQEVQGGDFESPQIAPQRGMLDDHFQRFLGSINEFWQREIALSALDQVLRKIYRRSYANRNV